MSLPERSCSPPDKRADTFVPWLFVALWSTGFIGAKFGLPHAEPLTFLSLRYALVLLLMGAGVWLMRAPWPATRAAWGHIAVAGLLLHGVYLAGVFVAIAHGLPAGITALIVGLQPLLTALGARAVLGEPVSRRQWLGLICGFVGVGMVVAGKTVAVSADALLGMLVPALAALLAITAGTLYQKRYCPIFDLRTGSVIQFLPCLVLTLAAASVTETMQIDWAPDFVFALGWLVLVLSLGAVSLLNVLIRAGSAVNVASLFYLVPPATALIAWALFDERLSGMSLAGMGLAVFGVWLARQTRG